MEKLYAFFNKIPFNGYKTVGSLGLTVISIILYSGGVIDETSFQILLGATGTGVTVGLVHKLLKVLHGDNAV